MVLGHTHRLMRRSGGVQMNPCINERISFQCVRFVPLPLAQSLHDAHFGVARFGCKMEREREPSYDIFNRLLRSLMPHTRTHVVCMSESEHSFWSPRVPGATVRFAAHGGKTMEPNKLMNSTRWCALTRNMAMERRVPCPCACRYIICLWLLAFASKRLTAHYIFTICTRRILMLCIDQFVSAPHTNTRILHSFGRSAGMG